MLVAESKGDSSARSLPLPQLPSAVDAARHQDEPLKLIRLTRLHKAPRTSAKLVYTVTYQPAIPSRLVISLRAAGLRASAGGLVCELPDWGEWASATFPYLRNLRIDGPPVAAPQRRHDFGTAGFPCRWRIEGSDLPAARSLLTAIGYDEVLEPAALTCLGIEARFTGPASTDDVVPAVVADVDAKGPGSKAGILPGDTIVGYGSRRVNPPELSSNAPERYRFGLNMIPSGARSVPLDVLRNGEKLQVTVTPVLIPGGQRASLRWNSERGKGFFEV